MDEQETPARNVRSDVYAVIMIAVFVIVIALSQVVHA
jgi:hypothetical protein